MYIIIENKKRALKYELEFRKVFGIPLKPYMDIRTGFDIIKFDDEFIKSGSGCMRDAIQAKYGDAGVKLIKDLIAHIEPPDEESVPSPEPGQQRMF